MAKHLILIILLLASWSSYADDYDNFNSDGEDYSHFNSTANDQYRNWKDVLNLLKSQGIDPRSIDWQTIDSACLGLKNRAPDVYNKCKYNKALNYSQYKQDLRYCDADAQQNYLYSEQLGVVSKQAEKRFKDSHKVLCMRDLGWEGNSWLAGKSYREDYDDEDDWEW